MTNASSRLLPAASAVLAVAVGIALAGWVDAQMVVHSPDAIDVEGWLWLRWVVSVVIALAAAGIYYALARRKWPRRRFVRLVPAVALVALVAAPIAWGGARAWAQDSNPLPPADLTSLTKLDVLVAVRGRAPAAPTPPPPLDRTGWDTRWSVAVIGQDISVILDAASNREAVEEALTGRRDDDASLVQWRNGARHVLVLDPYPIPAVAGGGLEPSPRGELPRAPNDFARRAVEGAPPDTQVFVVLSPDAPPRARDRWRRWAERRRGGLLLTGSPGTETLADAGWRAAVVAPEDSDDVALAWKFRPRLFLDLEAQAREGSGHLPANVDEFIASRKPSLCRLAEFGEECKEISSAGEIDGSYSFLDTYVSERDPNATSPTPVPAGPPSGLMPPVGIAPPGTGPPAQSGCDLPPGIPPPPTCVQSSPLYWFVRRNANDIYVGYWWFFPFNPTAVFRRSTCRPLVGIGDGACFDHASDWEGITVVARKNGRDMELVAVIYEQHGVMVRRTSDWLRKRWGDEWRDERPRVYVASGSHASYPTPCSSVACFQRPPLPLLPEGPHDGNEPWANNEGDCEWACLLRLPVTRTGDPTLWNAFPGTWGRRACIWWDAFCAQTTAPRSPGSTDRFLAPWTAKTQGDE